MRTFLLSPSLWVATGCLVALGLGPQDSAARGTADTLDAVQATRVPVDRSPAELRRLLALHDRMSEGPARAALADRIDRVAGQRYATVSRLFWHTDLAAAKAAAARENKPILALRMLGRLDEDLSCANSRLFRATLYANARVARLLRERFVLYWSSERAVPRVTIDFGGGRAVQTTTTGNSAHYVLDERGEVIDVLPGAWAPVAFEAELTKILAVARRIAALDAPRRRDALARYHREATAPLDEAWAKMAGTLYLPGARTLITAADVTTAIAQAQRATFAKAYIEVPVLERIASVSPGEVSDDATALWATVGQKTWGLGLAAAAPKAPDEPGLWFRTGSRLGAAPPPPPSTTAPRILDDASRALVTRLHQAGPLRATQAELDAVVQRLEQHLVADSAFNQYSLRRHIHHYLSTESNDLATTNAWIYRALFQTPADDAWLGLVPRTDFTGLPGDGVVVP